MQPVGDRRTSLLDDFSLEMTARDIEEIESAAQLLPADTQVSITFLPNEDFPGRARAAAAVRRAGLIPVPHISARRLTSAVELETFLDTLARDVGVTRVFVVAGDPPAPAGPYPDALAVIQSGLLGKYGVRHVGFAGYPDGHVQIGDGDLWRALHAKARLLGDLGHDFTITTQFGFYAAPVLAWLARLRREGVVAPVRLGVAGPASVKTLLRFAARCGVGASTMAMSKYGLSVARLLGNAGPDPMIAELVKALDPQLHGATALHVYPFGGLRKASEWVCDYTARERRLQI